MWEGHPTSRALSGVWTFKNFLEEGLYNNKTNYPRKKCRKGGIMQALYVTSAWACCFKHNFFLEGGGWQFFWCIILIHDAWGWCIIYNTWWMLSRLSPNTHVWCHVHFFHHVEFYFRFREHYLFWVSCLVAVKVWSHQHFLQVLYSTSFYGGYDVTLHLVGVFVIVWCRTMHLGAGLAPW